MKSVFRMSYICGFFGMLWTFMIIFLPKLIVMSEEEALAVQDTLVVGMMLTCCGCLIWSMGKAVQAIIDCLKDDDWLLTEDDSED